MPHARHRRLPSDRVKVDLILALSTHTANLVAFRYEHQTPPQQTKTAIPAGFAPADGALSTAALRRGKRLHAHRRSTTLQ